MSFCEECLQSCVSCTEERDSSFSKSAKSMKLRKVFLKTSTWSNMTSWDPPIRKQICLLRHMVDKRSLIFLASPQSSRNRLATLGTLDDIPSFLFDYGLLGVGTPGFSPPCRYDSNDSTRNIYRKYLGMPNLLTTSKRQAQKPQKPNSTSSASLQSLPPRLRSHHLPISSHPKKNQPKRRSNQYQPGDRRCRYILYAASTEYTVSMKFLSFTYLCVENLQCKSSRILLYHVMRFQIHTMPYSLLILSLWEGELFLVFRPGCCFGLSRFFGLQKYPLARLPPHPHHLGLKNLQKTPRDVSLPEKKKNGSPEVSP